MSSTWQQYRATRQQVESQRDSRIGGALEATRRRSMNGVGRSAALPGVGPLVAPVRILNPDGTLREVVSAEDFRRRRRPTDDAEAVRRKTRRRGPDMRWGKGTKSRAKSRGGEVGDLPPVRGDGDGDPSEG